MPTTALDDLYTVDEAARYLKLHPMTVRKKIWSGLIEGKKVGNRVYVTGPALAAYVNDGD